VGTLRFAHPTLASLFGFLVFGLIKITNIKLKRRSALLVNVRRDTNLF
jgi:hypothetical protein